DWQSYVHWVDAHPWLTLLSHIAYMSSGGQIIGFMFLLFLYHQTLHAQRFILAFFLSALMVIALSSLFPAVAGYVHYDIDLTQFVNLHPAAARIHEQPYMEMRNHSVNVLAFPLRGIVTFPSFHSTLAVLMVYASMPIRWLRIIAVP